MKKQIIATIIILLKTALTLANGDGRPEAYNFCSKITNTFTKNDCIEKVNTEQHWDFDAINSCKTISMDLLKKDCLSAISNKSYNSQEAKACIEFNDYSTIDCLKNSGQFARQEIPHTNTASQGQLKAYCSTLVSVYKNSCSEIIGTNPRVETAAFRVCLKTQSEYRDLYIQLSCLESISNNFFDDTVSQCENSFSGQSYITCLTQHMK